MLKSIVIVGAGQAGARAAQALRAGGYDGALHLVGAEPLAPYERPPLSKEFLTGELDVDRLALAEPGVWSGLGVELHLGTSATALRATETVVQLHNGTDLTYDRLILATGARPRRLPLEGAEGINLHYLRDVADALALRAELRPGRRLCVIGAGVIGLEVAASARALGVEVCVVERDPTPMSRIVPAEIGAWHRRLHERRGVAFHVGVTPTAIRQQGDQVVLDLSDATRIEADVVAVGIGVTPNVELLAECGMDLADGVLVDASGRSCDPGIFAVGDVSRPFRPLLGRAVRLESWRNAENQPKAAAATLLGAPTLHDDVPWMWSDQYGINLQVAGSPFDADFVVTRPADVEDRRTVLYLKRGVVVGGVTIDQGRDMRSIQQLIARRAVIDPVRLADRGLPLAVLAR